MKMANHFPTKKSRIHFSICFWKCISTKNMLHPVVKMILCGSMQWNLKGHLPFNFTCFVLPERFINSCSMQQILASTYMCKSIMCQNVIKTFYKGTVLMYSKDNHTAVVCKPHSRFIHSKIYFFLLHPECNFQWNLTWARPENILPMDL